MTTFLITSRVRWEEPRIGFILPDRLRAFSDGADGETGGVAPTEVDGWRGRLLCGEVHDQNAAALGGEAGHAGLFGSAEAVLAITGEWLKSLSWSNDDPRSGNGRRNLQDDRKQTDHPVGRSGGTLHQCRHLQGAISQLDRLGISAIRGLPSGSIPSAELEVVLLSNRVHPSSRE